MGNGSACTMASFYQKLGFDSIAINNTMDGLFPGRGPAPNEESLRPACREVLKKNADYGVGFDPDADRGIIIDDLGRVLPPEKVAIIIARARYKPGDLVISGFDCSMILERELEKDGIKVKREKVGDVFVANRVKNSGAVLGVERSGHFFLPEFQYSDDPFAMSLALGEIISQGRKLSRTCRRDSGLSLQADKPPPQRGSCRRYAPAPGGSGQDGAGYPGRPEDHYGYL